jgi:hypothetical protein
MNDLHIHEQEDLWMDLALRCQDSVHGPLNPNEDAETSQSRKKRTTNERQGTNPCRRYHCSDNLAEEVLGDSETVRGVHGKSVT